MRLFACLAALSLAAPATAQTTPPAPAPAPVQAIAPDPAFTARLNELPGLLAGTVPFESYFAPSFQAQVTKAKFQQVTAGLAAIGPFTGVESIEMTSPFAGTVRMGFRDAVIPMRLRVTETAPHQVDGLLFTGTILRTGQIKDPAAEIKALHGNAGFAVARLGTGAPQLLAGHNADTPFAIGSAFKLVILAELVRQTNAGSRKWDDLVTLDGTPLPGGGYTAKPKGTQVSLRELATQMISISDNSATDILLHTLGRERVEAMMPVLGIADPARNRPFLGTLDMFKLKGAKQGALATRYLALDAAGRRQMLDGEIAQLPLYEIHPLLFRDGKPVLIDKLEWYESPMDLVRVMDWLRRNTEGPAGADARAVLSKNPGVPLDPAKFPWIGFKGGSEPGVLNLTLLLQSKAGGWYVVTASWNDPAAAVDTQKLVTLVGALAEQAQP
jgi:hypothetical protein